MAETIIALSVLAMGITISSTVMMNSMRNMTNAKHRVVAVNIAREGIEAVRNIRDTNWLFYSDKRRQCWNHDPSALTSCDGLSPIKPGTYIVYKHTDQSWRLELADENPSLDTPDPVGDLDSIIDNDLDRVDLSLVDIDTSVNSDGLGGTDDDLDIYNHMDATNPLGELVKSTLYTRYIVIEYLENNPDPSTAPSNDTEPLESINTEDEWDDSTIGTLNRMRVTSVVGWDRRGTSYTAELKTIITDHLGREDLSS